MPTEIDHARVRELVSNRVPLIDVLGAETFKKSHIPHARNIPLDVLDGLAVADLDPQEPVIVYCDDFQ